MATNKTTHELNKESLEKRRREAVTDLVETVESNLIEEAKKKATVADYVRLVHLEQELVEEDPTPTDLGWEKPKENHNASEE